MPKQSIFIRTNDLTRKQLDELCEVLNETQAGVVALALDRMYREEIKDKDNASQETN